VTQGDLLAMVAYGLLILPLIRQLRMKSQTSFSRGTLMTLEVREKFGKQRKLFDRLCEVGPIYGHYPEPF
jgi:hypothetical protein